MGRYDLTDADYALIAPELPTNVGKTGHPWHAHRPILNGILWRLHTGAPWADILERYGPWQTIYDRYTWWRRDGMLDRILRALQLQLDARGLIDWEQWALDGTIVRAYRAAAGAPHNPVDGTDEPTHHALGRSVGGFSTKIHLLRDSQGVPLDVLLTPGQAHESTQVEPMLEHVAHVTCRIDDGIRAAWRRTVPTMRGAFARGCAGTASSRSFRPGDAREAETRPSRAL